MPVFPCVNGETRRAIEVIINHPDFKKIGGNVLPIIDLNIDISERDEYVTSFDFRKRIEFSEYLLVLAKISEVNTLELDNISEMTKRIGLIYRALLEFTETHKYEIEIRQWGSSHKILSTCNEFVYCNELYYLNIEHIKELPGSKKFFKVPSNIKHDKGLVNLLRSLGVQVVDRDDLKAQKIGSHKESKLQMCLIDKISLIALVAAKDTNNYQELLAQLHVRVNEVSFFKCDKLCLDYCVGGDLIHREERCALAQKSEFYYTGRWDRPVTLYDLTPELCRFLDIKDISQELNVLLQLPFEDGLHWLETQRYDVNQVRPRDKQLPDKGTDVDYVDPYSQAEKEDSQRIAEKAEKYVLNRSIKAYENRHSHETIRLKNTSTLQASSTDFDYVDTRSQAEKEDSQRIAEKAEKFVFDELIKVYENRYSHETIRIKSTSTFQTESVEIVWHAAKGNPYANRDITIAENGLIKYIEVKATKSDECKDTILHLSLNEWTLMKNSEDCCYFIARVFNAEEPSEITFIKMDKMEIDSL